jgi:hypothetical protein
MAARYNPARKNLFGFGEPKHWSETPGGYQRELKRMRGETAAARKKYAQMMGEKKKSSPRAIVFKGYRIFPFGDGFKTSADRGESVFDTASDAKRFITDEIKMARNPATARANPNMKTLKQSITGNWKMKLGTPLADQPIVGDTVLADGVERKVVEIIELGGLRSFVLEGDSKWRKNVGKKAALSAPVDWREALRKEVGLKEFDRMARLFSKDKHKNPAREAIEGYEAFHGRQPDEFVTVSRKVHFHKHLSGAGKLKKLVVAPVAGKRNVVLTGFGGALLAFNEKRNQLFVEGGDQAVDLAVFGIDSEHEMETLGRVTAIEYATTKDHLGSEGGTAAYVHKFRTTNQNGKHVTIRIARYPDLIYRTLDKQLEFSGGSYEILPEGIDR